MNNPTKGKHSTQATKAGMLIFKFSVLAHMTAQVNPVRVATLATLTPFLVSLFMVLTPNV